MKEMLNIGFFRDFWLLYRMSDAEGWLWDFMRSYRVLHGVFLYCLLMQSKLIAKSLTPNCTKF